MTGALLAVTLTLQAHHRDTCGQSCQGRKDNCSRAGLALPFQRRAWFRQGLRLLAVQTLVLWSALGMRGQWPLPGSMSAGHIAPQNEGCPTAPNHPTMGGSQ